MRYALLVYNDPQVDGRPDEQLRRITAEIRKALKRPEVTGWIRLRNVESATTVRQQQGSTLLMDGPFVESKEYLGGVILVEAENLDGALSVANDMQELRTAGAIEIRPVLEDEMTGA